MLISLAVRMIRQAISPRLAISRVLIIFVRPTSWRNLCWSVFIVFIGQPSALLPCGFALFQKGAQAFLALSADADTGNGRFGITAYFPGQFTVLDGLHQCLGRAHGLGAVQQQVIDPLL